MNWSKAKTILIIAFVITNIFLVYMLFNNYDIDEPTVKQTFIEDVVKLLKEKNIILDCEIPKQIPYLGMLNVEYEKRSTNDLNESFLEGRGKKVNSKENTVKIQNDDKSLMIIENKEILFENNKYIERYSFLDKNKAINIAKKFLNDKGYAVDDMKLTFKKEKDGVFYFKFTKCYNDVYVEESYTSFVIDKRGVKQFCRNWFNCIKLSEKKIYISTAPKSILGLLTMDEAYNKTITDISICYYFDANKHLNLSNVKNAKQGKAIPAWRVQFDDGTKIFLDQY